jgi:hypothetical protein
VETGKGERAERERGVGTESVRGVHAFLHRAKSVTILLSITAIQYTMRRGGGASLCPAAGVAMKFDLVMTLLSHPSGNYSLNYGFVFVHISRVSVLRYSKLDLVEVGRLAGTFSCWELMLLACRETPQGFLNRHSKIITSINP